MSNATLFKFQKLIESKSLVKSSLVVVVQFSLVIESKKLKKILKILGEIYQIYMFKNTVLQKHTFNQN